MNGNSLLLPLSRFNCVHLCATSQTAAHQASPSLGFSRQKHWSSLPLPSPEKMPIIPNYYRNANQNYNDVPPHISQNGHH